VRTPRKIGTAVEETLMTLPKSCTKQYFRIDRREIHFLKFILEGYGGLAVMRTIDPQEGVVVLHVSPGSESEVEAILDDIGRQIKIEAARPVDEEVS
jgi:hypothetical protein